MSKEGRDFRRALIRRGPDSPTSLLMTGSFRAAEILRRAQPAAHLVDHVFPHVPVRQSVLSVPKRLRPFLHHGPGTASAILERLFRNCAKPPSFPPEKLPRSSK